jgi:hypothetical protein
MILAVPNRALPSALVVAALVAPLLLGAEVARAQSRTEKTE